LVVFVLAVNVVLETWSMYHETTVTAASAVRASHRPVRSEIKPQISWVTRASVVTPERRTNGGTDILARPVGPLGNRTADQLGHACERRHPGAAYQRPDRHSRTPCRSGLSERFGRT
jgi:hypothetical protein